MRATNDGNLQCNIVVRQVERKCCPYYLALRSNKKKYERRQASATGQTNRKSGGRDGAISKSKMAIDSFPGAGEKTLQIFVSESSNKN